MTKIATLTKSPFGNPQPTLELSFPTGVGHRVRASEVYKVAAQVELASGKEQWAVVVNVPNCSIHLELLTGSEAEAKQGMKVLNSICR